jgi:hypothetical protein
MLGRQATKVITRARFTVSQGQFEGLAQQLGGLLERSGARRICVFHQLPICRGRAGRWISRRAGRCYSSAREVDGGFYVAVFTDVVST